MLKTCKAIKYLLDQVEINLFLYLLKAQGRKGVEKTIL